MATQTRYPQSNAHYAGNYSEWADKQNAYADDAATTYYTVPEGLQYKYATTRYYNFGFDIPAGSTINSVTMTMQVYKSAGQSNDWIEMQLYKNTTARGTAYQKTNLPSSATDYSSTNTGTWTAEELNANTVADGPSLMLKGRGESWYLSTLHADCVSITVDYTETIIATDFSGAVTFGFSASAVSTLLNVAYPNRLGTLRLYSPDRDTLWAETMNYKSVQITRRFTGNSLLEAYFYADSDEAYYIPEGGWIEDDEGEWYRIEYRRATSETVQVIAYSPHKMLSQRITVPGVGDYGLSLTGTPDEVVKYLIDQSVRSLPITTAADDTTGSDISEVSRYKNLADEVARICEANGRGERFTPTVGGFEFDTYAGSDRTRSNTDDNPPVVFSVRYDNLEDWAHSISAVDEITTVYVAGQGEGTLRTILITGDATTGEDRRELFRDARDTDDNDVLTERGAQSTIAVAEALTAKVNTSSNLTYNSDYHLGDLVTIEIPERGATFTEGIWERYDSYRSADKRITEIIRTYEGGSIDIDLIFGDAPKTRADKTAETRQDIARLEAI